MIELKHRKAIGIAGACLSIAGAIWLVWPERNDGNASRPLDPEAANRTAKPSRRDGDAARGQPGEKTRTSPRRDGRGSDDLKAMDEIDTLLLDQSLEHEDVAVQLKKIAENPRLSIDVREDAMGHGLMLSVPVFAGMAADANLPEELAMQLLDQVTNYNELPIMQLETYLDLLKHRSEEISQDALDLLRFELEDDLDELALDEIIARTQAKMVELRNQPVEGQSEADNADE